MQGAVAVAGAGEGAGAGASAGTHGGIPNPVFFFVLFRPAYHRGVGPSLEHRAWISAMVQFVGRLDCHCSPLQHTAPMACPPIPPPLPPSYKLHVRTSAPQPGALMVLHGTDPCPPPPLPRDASEGKGPQRWPQRRLDRRLEGVAKAVGGGYCRLSMPLRLALGVWDIVAGHRLDALDEGRGGSPPSAMPPPPLQCPGGCDGLASVTGLCGRAASLHHMGRPRPSGSHAGHRRGTARHALRQVCATRDVEKIKTIGDCYMCVGWTDPAADPVKRAQSCRKVLQVCPRGGGDLGTADHRCDGGHGTQRT